MNFLDTKIKKDKENNLYTDLYVKPTDTNSYLKFNSAHPPRCKESFPYSQFLRIKRICTNEEDYIKHPSEKEKEFLEKGYPPKVLQKAKDKVETSERKTLLQRKQRTQDTGSVEKVIITVTYRDGYACVPKIIKKNWHGRPPQNKYIEQI